MCVQDADGEESLPTSTLNGGTHPYESATTEPSPLTLITLESTHTSAPQSTANYRHRHNKTPKKRSKDAKSIIYSQKIQSAKDPLKLQY
eukprot:scaffold146204_cov30-Attheya_sp.AAC.1